MDIDAVRRANDRLRSAGHPSLVPFVQVDPRPLGLHLQRRLIDGVSIRHGVADAGPGRIRRWFSHLASVLVAIDQAGAVHGAIHAENVRIDPAGGLWVVDGGVGVDDDWHGFASLALALAPPTLGPVVREICERAPTPRDGITILAALVAETSADDAEADRYRDLGLIGRGGMGEVRRVYDPVLQRVLALKRPLPGAPRAADRLVSEARILASLHHPGIVSVHDFGRTVAGTPYFTMPVATGRPLGRTHSLDVVRRLCDAVGHAHACGIAHLDLKPSNIIVDDEGAVVVIDWGLASRIGATRSQIAGTLGFAPPEQLSAICPVDPRWDVFALGAVLRHVAPDQVEVADRAMSSDPADRYPDAGAMGQALGGPPSGIARP